MVLKWEIGLLEKSILDKKKVFESNMQGIILDIHKVFDLS